MTKSSDKSPMFLYYWRILATDAPYPTAEYRFAMPRRYRFDWAFVSRKVAVEIDGGQWMPSGGRHNKDADRDKLNLAASMGWVVFHFSPDQLSKNPDGCIRLVLDALL